MSSPVDLNARRRFLLSLLGGGASMFWLPESVHAGVRAAVRQASTSLTDVGSRLVIDLNAPVDHKVFTLNNPERVVLDLNGTVLPGNIDLGAFPSGSIVSRMRSGIQNGYDLRLVLDVHQPTQPRALLMPSANGRGFQLVLDLPHKPLGLAAPANVAKTEAPAAPAPVSPPASARRPVPVKEASRGGLRDLVIAIDAGHGGKDPGAIGRNGTREKDVTLAIARKLDAMLRRERGFKPVMTRNSDVFIPLRERTRIARKHKADMFISIHADAFHNTSARGASVFCLSLNGASSEAARWMADKENSADLVGGVSLSDRSDNLASVLLDLSQTASLQASLDAGQRVLTELRQIGSVHKREVQQAGFMVLKSPDIPSLLVESAFISNPEEERKLRTAAHQEKVARSVFRGLHSYYASKAIEGTHFAML
ncbi:MAG TPA: AMIN domain-containing protein [Chromatiales bacterium]|nr:AMIN domain-containing protein [Chromatiales bacterium]